MTKFKAQPLPYTMGNAGDLIKHGLLCELINWLSKESAQNISFYDPFGGRPWQQPINNEVRNRLEKLQSCPLKSSQSDPQNRYFGSGHIIKNLADINKRTIHVFTSDRDKNARIDLQDSGLNLIDLNDFNPDSAYSILDCRDAKEKNCIILLDPFYDLQYINKTILKKIVDRVSLHSIAVVLYVLYREEEMNLWQNFQAINKQLRQDKVHFYALACKPITGSAVMGESKFHSFVSLYMNKSFSEYKLASLNSSLREFSENLKAAINTELDYTDQLIE